MPRRKRKKRPEIVRHLLIFGIDSGVFGTVFATDVATGLASAAKLIDAYAIVVCHPGAMAKKC